MELKLGYQTEKMTYVTSQNHRLLGVGEKSASILNIGENGNNLTIAVLSLNRASLTIKLMESIREHIPEFAGEFLIGDNGSEEIEKEKLRDAMAQMPYACRMVEFDRNYGVGGGRNRLNQHVQTDWILQLDNDIYFAGNPLSKIGKDIALLGCHFLVMPLVNADSNQLFLYGGNLYAEPMPEGISIGGGSAFLPEPAEMNIEQEPFLCTFVPGGTCVMNRHTFQRLGGYDENMFIGFEDTEFSLRVFQAGYKIGNCGVVSLIHDHPKPTLKQDADYEKERFSKQKLFESAKYFEQKHGFYVWNPSVENWVEERKNELLNKEKTASKSEEPDNSQEIKKKILLVVDAPNWALDHIAQQIIKHCSDVFEFGLLYLSDIDNVSAVFSGAKGYDMIHFLWRSWAAEIDSDYTKGYAGLWGMPWEKFYERYIAGKTVTVSVYDHLFLNEQFDISYNLFSNPQSVVKGYAVSSQILRDIYEQDERILMKPSAIVTDGVDLDMFYPKEIDRLQNVGERELVVGWAGNSKWNAAKEDFKGLHTILIPAVEQLQNEGYKIKLNVADSNVKRIPHEEMIDYYKTIDLYVCPSKIEGTPNPILEAMACGVPFVSTNVGIVPEAAGIKQKEFILEERSVECLKSKLKYLLDNPMVLGELSIENLDSIKDWEWRKRVRRFIDFWKQFL